jgi:hypothetical protein
VLGSSVPGAKVPAGRKDVCTLEAHGSAGDRTVPLQCPTKARVPKQRTRAGGVSERAGAKAGGSNPFAIDSFACRGGERHPGLLEGVALRGVASEKRPWSVRRLRGYPPAEAPRRRQRMSGGCRGGERRRACATKCMRPTQAREIVACASGTRPSLGPPTRACRSSLCTGAQVSVVGRTLRHHGWASPRKWEEPTLGPG